MLDPDPDSVNPDPKHWFLGWRLSRDGSGLIQKKMEEFQCFTKASATTSLLQSAAYNVLLTSPAAIFHSSCHGAYLSLLPNKQLFLAAILQLLDVESGEPPVHIRPFSSVEELTALAQKRICFRHWLKHRIHRSLSLRVCLWCLVVLEGGNGVHNWSGNFRLLNKEDVNAILGSVTFWCGSGSSDPYFWLTDPDPTPDSTPFFGDF